MLFAYPVAGATDVVIAPLVGMVVLVIREADRIENQVVMDVIPVYVGGEGKLIFSPQDLPRCLLYTSLAARSHVLRAESLIPRFSAAF